MVVFILDLSELRLVNHQHKHVNHRYFRLIFSIIIRLFGMLGMSTFTLIGDHTKANKAGKAMAFSGATIGLSALIGPAFGGAMAARAQIETVFMIVAGLFALTGVLSIWFVSESYKKSERGQVQLKDLSRLLRNRPLIQASIAAFSLMMSNGTLSFPLPLHLESVGFTTSITGGLMSLFAGVALIIFLTPLNKIYNKHDPMSLVTTGLLFITIALLFLSQVATLTYLGLAMVIYGIGFAFVFPSMNQLVTLISTQKERGKAYGIFYAPFSLGAVAGSSLA
ncbi:MFS transporter [Amphibacillus cookii]|uniref:MFS transporter n=1 Tax=Amphibacillus cookii TaxID=767787 RepID=UPI0030844DF3